VNFCIDECNSGNSQVKDIWDVILGNTEEPSASFSNIKGAYILNTDLL
jgi:hypothetical protein